MTHDEAVFAQGMLLGIAIFGHSLEQVFAVLNQRVDGLERKFPPPTAASAAATATYASLGASRLARWSPDLSRRGELRMTVLTVLQPSQSFVLERIMQQLGMPHDNIFTASRHLLAIIEASAPSMSVTDRLQLARIMSATAHEITLSTRR